ncbi:MAG: hypothetical protein N2037_01935 [Acidimicrobiales bacterium]|nr:hypothetical protein [Acidimicrobiales bacterium]
MVGILVVVGLISGAFLLGRTRRVDVAVDELPTSTTQPPSTRRAPATSAPRSTTTFPPADPATIEREVETLSRFVEQKRGLTFKQKVQVHVAGDEEFNRLLLEDFDEEREDLEKAAAAFEALGMVEPGTDVAGALRKLLEVGVLGFYDPEKDELVVRGDHLSPYVRQTIVHELTHALDDQWFDLDRPEYDERHDEVGFGLSAVAEGNARRIEQAYEAQMTPEEKAARDREEAEFIPDLRELASIPAILIQQISAPYDIGESLVEQLKAIGGQDAVDEALSDPPSTTEQALDVDKYLAREPAEPVATPPAEGEIVDSGMFGELMTRLLLDDVGTSTEVDRAARGWGGDAYVVWRGTDRRACARIDWRMETPTDADELGTMLRRWVFSQVRASVEELDQRSVRLTSCSR